MLARNTKTINISAVSAADIIGDTGIPVMTMQASIGNNGAVNINISIPDNSLYKKNEESASSDYADFLKSVIDTSASVSGSETESGD